MNDLPLVDTVLGQYGEDNLEREIIEMEIDLKNDFDLLTEDFDDADNEIDFDDDNDDVDLDDDGSNDIDLDDADLDDDSSIIIDEDDEIDDLEPDEVELEIDDDDEDGLDTDIDLED